MALGRSFSPTSQVEDLTEGPTFGDPAEPVLEDSTVEYTEGSETPNTIYQDLLDQRDTEDDEDVR